jgi:glutathione-regulated potassium-efflux system ancillary protein KefC
MEGNFLLATFVLLAAAVALAPLAKWIGLSTIIGYLAAGVLIGPYGLRLISDSGTIQQIADLGIVMMLFLIGLELHPAELWRMRNKVLGLGLTQMLGTSAI